MDAVFYVMAIMGCSDGSTACAQARVEPVRYVTPKACQAAMPGALARNSDLSFPVISAACHASGFLAADREAPARGDKRG